MTSQIKFVVIGALAMALCGIAVVSASGSSQGGLWLDVPYVHQEKDGCGSASLAMVLRYWQTKNFDVPVERMDPARIQSVLYSAKPHGIYASDMEKYLRETGFEVFAFRGEWSDLRAQLAKGRPLIAGLKPKGAPAHYVVVVGMNSEDTAALVNDPERGKLVHVERREFERDWRGTEDWTLLGVPLSR